MATATTESPLFYCHNCNERIHIIGEDVICPKCDEGFVEKLENEESQRSSQRTFDDFSDLEDDEEGEFSFSVFEDAMRQSFSNNLGAFRVMSRLQANESSSSGSSTDPPVPYNLRLRPNRPATSEPGGSDSENRGLDQDIIQDVLLRVLGGFSPRVDSSPGGSPGAFPFLTPTSLHGDAGDYAWGPNGLDDVISQLLGQLENSGPPPASEKTISGLPKISIKRDDVASGRDCSVCMDTFEAGEDASRLPCGHFFHGPCIEPWLKLHNTCPICRKVVEDDSCTSQTPETSSRVDSANHNSSSNSSVAPTTSSPSHSNHSALSLSNLFGWSNNDRNT